MTPVKTTHGTRWHCEWFSGEPSIDVEYSRFRFVYASDPSQNATWQAIQAEYRQIKAALSTVQDDG